MLAGHVHSYERFGKDGKAYVVTGGGGGPRVTLLRDTRRRHSDLFEGPSLRTFHFLLGTPSPAGIEFEMMALTNRDFAVPDRFTLDYARAS